MGIILKFEILFLFILFSSYSYAKVTEYKRFANINWRKSADAVTYLLEISKEPKFKEVILAKALTEPQFRWENPPIGSYYFRVAIKDKYGQQSEFSESRNLIIALQTPKLVDYVDNEEKKLEWKNYTQDISSLLEISNDRNFSTILLQKKINDNQFNISELKPGSYFWRVTFIGPNNIDTQIALPKPLVITQKQKDEKKTGQEAQKQKPSGTNFVIVLGPGYSSNQVEQSTATTDTNFININGKTASFTSLFFRTDWWPKTEKHWLNISFNYSYSKISSNFLTGTGSSAVNKIDIETSLRYEIGIFAFYAGLGYQHSSVFFIKSDGSVFNSARNYITESFIIGIKPNPSVLLRTGLQLSTFPSNKQFMPLFETFYLFQKWLVGIRVTYSWSNIPIQIVNPSDQSLLNSGNDTNKNFSTYFLIGLKI